MDSNIKRFLAYFLYVLLLAYLLIRADDYFNHLPMSSSTSAPIHLWPALLFPVAVGLLLALPRLITTISQSGSWTYDWVLFLAVGLPALVVQLLACFSLLPLLNPTGNITFYHGNLVSISGLVLGYILLAAFKKAYSWF